MVARAQQRFWVVRGTQRLRVYLVGLLCSENPDSVLGGISAAIDSSSREIEMKSDDCASENLKVVGYIMPRKSGVTGISPGTG
jgi:hypothetical protein